MKSFGSYGSVAINDYDYMEALGRAKDPQLMKDDDFPKSYWNIPRWIGLGALVVISAGAGVIMTSYSSSPSSKVAISEVAPKSSSSIEISSFAFTLRRIGYDPLDTFINPDAEDALKYTFLTSHVAVIEPNADMNLYISPDEDNDALHYHYHICSASKPDECSKGAYSSKSTDDVVVNIGCTPKDTYNIVVHKYISSSNELIGEASGSAICSYVRREIRALIDADLEKTMDAMFALYQHSDEEGKKLYGSNYRSMNYLLQIHYFNAAWQDGDHIHEGNGFITQHIKLTNIYELAMQAVDPSVALPYWDFTIESAAGNRIWESPIFSAKMFGNLTQAKDEYWGWTVRGDTIESAAIPDGRWAKLKADRNTMFPDLNYAFGYLRAPWSMNPSPYLSRFTSNNKNFPTCSSHYDLLDYDRLADFFFMVPYAAHAPTHGSIGGVYGCDLFDPLREAGYIIDEDSQVNLCKNWIFYMKEFFRTNFIFPKKGCSMSSDNLDVDTMDCGFECDPTRTKDLVFALKNILNSDNTCVPSDMPNEGWIAWKDFVCDGDGYKIFGGDHLESASAADPSFWPIHPTLERLLHAKTLAGGFLSTRWATSASEEYVCDKASCYDSELGFGFWEGCCYGHYLDDRFLDPEAGSRTSYAGLTNREVIEGTDASSADYNMPYIYDKFDWSHCEEEGHDFSAKIVSLKALAESRKNLTPEEIAAIVNSKSKIQVSTGGLKDKVNDKVGTNMYDPTIGVDPSNVPGDGKGKGGDGKPPVVPKI